MEIGEQPSFKAYPYLFTGFAGYDSGPSQTPIRPLRDRRIPSNDGTSCSPTGHRYWPTLANAPSPLRIESDEVRNPVAECLLLIVRRSRDRGIVERDLLDLTCPGCRNDDPRNGRLARNMEGERLGICGNNLNETRLRTLLLFAPAGHGGRRSILEPQARHPKTKIEFRNYRADTAR